MGCEFSIATLFILPVEPTLKASTTKSFISHSYAKRASDEVRRLDSGGAKTAPGAGDASPERGQRVEGSQRNSFRIHSYAKTACKSFISHSYKILGFEVPQNHTLTKKGGGEGGRQAQAAGPLASANTAVGAPHLFHWASVMRYKTPQVAFSARQHNNECTFFFFARSTCLKP
jgi:hypothetical protein